MEELVVTTDDGVRLWVAVDGDPSSLDRPDTTVVVLCHGGPGLWDELGPLAALLPEGTAAIRWEQRGCGRSDRAGPYTVDRSVADLETIRAHLGIDQWVVAGHSYGATLALHAAFAHPERAQALLYLSGTGIGREWNPAFHAEIDRRLTDVQRARRDALEAATRTRDEEVEWRSLVWAPDFADRTRALTLAAEVAAAPFEVNVEANRTIVTETKTWHEADLAASCADLDLPVLVLHGQEDPRPAWAVDSLVAALPRADLRVLPGAGHRPWDEAPGPLADALASFLAELDPTP